MNCTRIIATLAFLLFAVPLAHAQTSLIVSDGFSGSPGSITGQYGGYGWQYAVNWTSSSTTNPNQVKAGSLSFSKNGQLLTASGNLLQAVGSNVGAFRKPPTTFGAYGGSVNQEIWISFLAANTTADLKISYAGLSLFNTTEQFFIGVPQGANGYGFQNVSSNNSDPSALVLDPNYIAANTQTHFIVAHFSFTASGTTEVKLYVDPTPGVDTADANGARVPTQDPALDKIYTFGFQFNEFRFQSGPDAHAYNFDELRMGKTYLDVAPATASSGVVGAPTAHSQSVTTGQGQAVTVVLTGNDTNSPARALTYAVTTSPLHGTLTGTSPSLTYTPASGYIGTDSFQFKANNGTLDSTPATVSITINQTRASVSGVVTLQSCTSSAQPLVFTLTPTGTTTGSVSTQTLTPGADGSFILSNVVPGTYTLGIKGSKWLRKTTSVDATHGNVSGINVSLLGGDVNNDNQITGTDLAIVRKANGSSIGTANWNTNADLNCDSKVNTTDIAILRSNYGKNGN